MNNNPYHPCILASYDGIHRITMPSMNTDEYFETLEAYDIYGNGYAWEGLVQQLLEQQMPDRLSQIDFDSEADTFVGYCQSKASQETIAKLMQETFTNEQKFVAFLKGIDRSRIDD